MNTRNFPRPSLWIFSLYGGGFLVAFACTLEMAERNHSIHHRDYYSVKQVKFPAL